MDAGETESQAAERELPEETGYRARKWVKLGVVHDNPGWIEGRTTLFWATDLEKVTTPHPERTEQVTVEWHALTWLETRIRMGEITDRIVLSAFALWTWRSWSE